MNFRVTQLMCIRIAANVLWLRKINMDKASGKYAQFEGSGDDRDPEFMMVL
jgi:hypothetical protein